MPFAFPRLHLPDFSVSKGQDVTKLDPGMSLRIQVMSLRIQVMLQGSRIFPTSSYSGDGIETFNPTIFGGVWVLRE